MAKIKTPKKLVEPRKLNAKLPGHGFPHMGSDAARQYIGKRAKGKNIKGEEIQGEIVGYDPRPIGYLDNDWFHIRVDYGRPRHRDEEATWPVKFSDLQIIE